MTVSFFIQTKVKGYAISGRGRGIERVDVSIDGGTTWSEARIFQRQKQGSKGDHYIPDDERRDKWGWVLWELEVQLRSAADIIVKCVCFYVLLLP